MACQLLPRLFQTPLSIGSKRFQIGTLNRLVHYVQGQSPEPGIREYFYYIDHQAQLFLDDAKMKNFTSCYKEQDFLVFFFKRLRFNDTDRYRDDFPYLSLCGKERNFLRCDDTPLVFTHIVHSPKAGEPDRLAYNGAGDRLTVPFEPEKMCMFPKSGPKSGRLYHPAPKKVGGVGLIRSVLALELSTKFMFART